MAKSAKTCCGRLTATQGFMKRNDAVFGILLYLGEDGPVS
jgi:hypothetical protein